MRQGTNIPTLVIISLGILSAILAKNSKQVAVTTISDVPTWKRASTDEEMALLYKDNLGPDFEPYSTERLHVDKIISTVSAILGKRQSNDKATALILIRKGKVKVMPLHDKPWPLTMKRIASMTSAIGNNTLPMPDTLFIFHAFDSGVCTSTNVCQVPVFSLIKKLGLFVDILLPFFNHHYQELYEIPWEQKTRKALMRAALQNGMTMNSTRIMLLDMAKNDPVMSKLLDIGITNNLKKGATVKVVPQVKIPDHARWTWLISADGFTASCRFGKLLGTNSIVLKEESDWVEYYYRSAIPNMHYVPWTASNFKEVLLNISQDDERAKRLSLAGQRFMYTYLGKDSKVLYVRQALTRYNALFQGEMESIISRLPSKLPRHLTAKSFMSTLKSSIKTAKGEAE